MKIVNCISVRIKRGDDAQSWIQEYKVPYTPGRSVLQLLKMINEEIDPTLTFYGSCRLGKCGLCKMLINGNLRLACITPVLGDLLLEPDPSESLIRDLLVNISS